MKDIIEVAKSKKRVRAIKETGMHVPLLVHTILPGLPKKVTMDAEKQVAEDSRLASHIAVMSDANKKKKILHPASSVAASEGYVIPQLFDAAPNCGMRLITTDLTDEEVNGAKGEQLYQALVKHVPAKIYFAKPLPLRVIIASFLRGSAPVAKHLKVRTKNEIEHTYEQGDMFNAVPEHLRLKNVWDLIKIVPPVIVFFAKYRLGILGATNSHFLSLMKVDKILHAKAAKKMGLKQGQYVFYLHTGSGMIGRYIGQLYSSQKHMKLSHALQLFVARLGYISRGYREVKRLIKKSRTQKEVLGFRAGTRPADMCIQSLQAAGNQGFANRTVITHALDKCLEQAFGRQVDLQLIYDAPHVLLSRETHNGTPLWVHRNGTTRALGPALAPLKNGLGEPGLMASYENTWGYLGVGTDANSTTFTSANHELGKLENTPASALQYPKQTVEGRFDDVHVYSQKRTWTVSPSAQHAAFAEEIAREVQENDILQLVARMRTIRVLTHYKR